MADKNEVFLLDSDITRHSDDGANAGYFGVYLGGGFKSDHPDLEFTPLLRIKGVGVSFDKDGHLGGSGIAEIWSPESPYIMQIEMPVGTRVLCDGEFQLRVAHRPIDPQEVEDMLDEAIGDSIDMDWNSRVGAKAIVRALERDGFQIVKLPSAKPEAGDARP